MSRLVTSKGESAVSFQCCTKSDGLSTTQPFTLVLFPPVGGKTTSGVRMMKEGVDGGEWMGTAVGNMAGVDLVDEGDE
jgi:hypothetical protein